MAAMRTAGHWTALALLVAIAGGCGWFGGGEKPAANERVWTAPPPVSGPLSGLARAGAIYDIYSVTPNQGPLPGGNKATLRGIFPPTQTIMAMYGAASTYQVYFGNNFAQLDGAIVPPFTSNEIHVIVPPGDAPGFVDVILRDINSNLDAATLYDGYEYIDNFAITDVVPDVGPLSGGQHVTVFGRFPILAPIATAAQAYAAYRVYFDGIQAPYDTSVTPIITSTRMYVITPPGNAPGLVNVAVATTVYTNQQPEFRVLVDGYEYIGGLELTNVDPNIGHIFGREPVTLTGTFPVTQAFSDMLDNADAGNYYTVLFGTRVAPFDVSMPTPVITPTEMHVLSPPNPDIGFVDVSVIAKDNPTISSTLDRAYRYYAMLITDIYPDRGPLPGGNGVRISGLFPVFDTINNVYTAEQYYTVFFGTQQASFSNIEPPVIQPATNIDVMNATFDAGSMYVIAPPGLALGPVDVTVVDDLGIDLPAVAPDGYTYLGETSLGQWVEAQIQPNPVGKLPAGDLLVRVEVTGDITANERVFIVPHGADPNAANFDGLIGLDNTAVGVAGDNTFWEGTNPDEIPRVLDGNLVDGHAALIIVTADDTRIGASSDLTDGGNIAGNAVSDRHFIIDTVPPRMRVGSGLIGDNFLISRFDAVANWRTLPGVVDQGAYPTVNHPYPLPPSNLPIGRFDFVSDASTITRPATEDSRAQLFFNTASLSNDAVPAQADLRFQATVTFEDVDIYTALNRTPTAADANFFTGSRIRPVAGFPVSPVGPGAGLDRDPALVDGDNVLIRWDFEPTVTRTPNITDIGVTYSSGGTPAADTAIPGELAGTTDGRLGPFPTVLTGDFDIGNQTDINTGVQFDDIPPEGAKMQVVFRAVDRAGDYFPRGDTTLQRVKLFTQNDFDPDQGFAPNRQPIVGPLNLWWLLTTSTRLTSSVPPGGDARNPSFEWEITNTPNPRAVPFANPVNSVQRLYNFAIFRNVVTDVNGDGQIDARDVTETREELYDGPYEMLTGWFGWDTPTSLAPARVQTLIANSLPANDFVDEGVWFLIVVVSSDEAGNVEIWPTSQLDISTAPITGDVDSPSRIERVIDTKAEERNWVRWYVPPVGQVVDTQVTPLFWHDSLVQGTTGQPDANEANFGDAEVIPLPPVKDFPPQPGTILQDVAARFRIRTFTESGQEPSVSWSLEEDGNPVFTDEVIPNIAMLGNDAILTLPNSLYPIIFGDRENRQPRYYVFRARTFVDLNNSGTLDDGDIVDTTPANVPFVVVDNVAEYIQNRRSSEAQPIREQDRP